MGWDLPSVTRQMMKDSTGKKQLEFTGSLGTSFFLVCNGQIEFGKFHAADNLYCRYSVSHGNDWSIVQGVDAGLSQIARKSGGDDKRLVWNFPIDMTFKSTNAFGWPRIAISVYSIDSLGRDVVQGYGSALLPTTSGHHEQVVTVYRPVASTLLQHFLSWISGTLPEFFDSKFVNQGEGREVTRVESTGVVKLTFNVTTKGMASFGYSAGGCDNYSSTSTSQHEYSTPLWVDEPLPPLRQAAATTSSQFMTSAGSTLLQTQGGTTMANR